MSSHSLVTFLKTYIEGRKQPKLEAFDKETEKNWRKYLSRRRRPHYSSNGLNSVGRLRKSTGFVPG